VYHRVRSRRCFHHLRVTSSVRPLNFVRLFNFVGVFETSMRASRREDWFGSLYSSLVKVAPLRAQPRVDILLPSNESIVVIDKRNDYSFVLKL